MDGQTFRQMNDWDTPKTHAELRAMKAAEFLTPKRKEESIYFTYFMTLF